MPKALLTLKRIKRINYSTLREGLRLLPSLPEAERDAFPLSRLNYAQLKDQPEFPKEVTAKVLIRGYHALGYSITSPKELLINPGDATLEDLAKFIKKRHIPSFVDDVAGN